MSGTSAEQFALLGAVFLILGAAFVFAPQIVSAINGFLATVFRRGGKGARAKAAVNLPQAQSRAEPEASSSPAVPSLAEEYGPPADHAAWSEEPESAPSSSAVARLREEISSSWSRGGER